MPSWDLCESSRSVTFTVICWLQSLLSAARRVQAFVIYFGSLLSKRQSLARHFCQIRKSPAARQTRGIWSQGVKFHDKSFMLVTLKIAGYTQNPVGASLLAIAV